jgi:hypothetical protein
MKSVLLLLALAVPVLATSTASSWAMEETGESGLITDTPSFGHKVDPPKGQVLLIPDSNADVVGMYSPYDGTYYGDFIVNDTTGLYSLSTPINAIQPNGYDLVFLSDQIADAVYAFDGNGDFLYTLADDTWLNNVRGIDFRNDTVFVTSGDDYVAMFSAPMTYAGNFISDGTDPFDILFVDEVESGSALLCDIQGTTDNIRHYYADGTLMGELFSVNFPEQVQVDIANPGEYLAAGFSADSIYHFTIDGTILDKWYHNGPRGVFRLGNGNILFTDGSGVHEMDPATGSIIETEYSGSCRFIELVDLSGVPVGESSFSSLASPMQLSIYPNPFHDQLSIAYTLGNATSVRVDIYSIAGRIVRTMEPGVSSAGSHSLVWDGTSDSGEMLGQGIYFVRMTTPEGMVTKKVNLIR